MILSEYMASKNTKAPSIASTSLAWFCAATWAYFKVVRISRCLNTSWNDPYIRAIRHHIVAGVCLPNTWDPPRLQMPADPCSDRTSWRGQTPILSSSIIREEQRVVLAVDFKAGLTARYSQHFGQESLIRTIRCLPLPIPYLLSFKAFKSTSSSSGA